MKPKIVVYEPYYNENHKKVLRAFAIGCGAEVRDVRDYVECDIAVIFGLPKISVKETHSKYPIVARHQGRRLIVIDSAPQRRKQYWAVGYGGIAGNAQFFNHNAPPDRWTRLKIELQPYDEKRTGPILVCGQLPHDATVQYTDHVGWCERTVKFYVDRKDWVLFRPHPKITNAMQYGVDTTLWDTNTLAATLRNARCVVTWNSTIGVDALIAGTPVIAVDKGSFVYPIVSHELTDVDKPLMPDRKQWAASLAYCMWSIKELENGLAWHHLSVGWE
jgi:hypothetical protein